MSIGRKWIPVAVLCAVSAMAVALLAHAQEKQTPANVQGNWTLIVHHPDPKKYFTEALTFHQDGSKVIGEFKRVWPVLKGDDHSMQGFVDGSRISFDVWHHNANAINVGGTNTFTYYKGTVNGDTMSGTGFVNGEDVTWIAKKGITGEFRDGKF
jgi:hypothetical protein